MSKKTSIISIFILSIVGGQSANAQQYAPPQPQQYQQPRMAPGRQNTGWNNGQGQAAAANPQQTQARGGYVPQQAITTPYNYYNFPQQDPRGVRVTNGVPGYGKTQNPYQSSDSEKGFYILVGYSMGTDNGGGVTSELQNYDLPGNWQGRSLGDTTAFSIGAGTNMSGSLRVEFAYTSYSGLQYYDKAIQEYENIDEDLGELSNPVLESEGISSDNFSLGFYYSMKDIFGDFLGGMFTPYIGGSMGISYNKLGSYTVEMTNGVGIDIPDDCYSIMDGIENGILNPLLGQTYCNGMVGGEGMTRYIGSTTPSFSIGMEVGLTMNIQENIALDFYYKNNKLGSLSTSGDLITTQSFYDVLVDDETLLTTLDGNGYPLLPDYDASAIMDEDGVYTAYYYYSYDETVARTSTKESGDINIWEFGIKLRAFF